MRVVLIAGIAAIAATLAAMPAPVQARASEVATPSLAIDEGRFIDINGMEQWITIRGTKRDNPVLLILHGGPGFPMSFLAPMYAEWEKRFTIVQWDQPATGATLLRRAGQPSGDLSIDRYVRDGIAITEWVRKHLGKDRIVLLGTSWGGILGVEMVQRRPDLYTAYVGAAQPVGAIGNRLGYQMALEAARGRGDTAGVDALQKVGPPPYDSFDAFMVRQRYSNPPAVPATPGETRAAAEMIEIMMKPAPGARYNAPVTIPPGYDGGFMAAQQATWREAWRWEASKAGLSFKVPVYLFQGEVDMNTPTVAARSYFDAIRAPRKAFEVVPGAGHTIILFHRELLALLEKHAIG
jgi:pimeloyl-ACP methyl ester carboxylesterase